MHEGELWKKKQQEADHGIEIPLLTAYSYKQKKLSGSVFGNT